LQPRTALVKPPPRLLVEKRRAGPAPRQASLLQSEHEDCVEAPGARALEVDHGHAAGVVAASRSQRGALDRREKILAGQVSAQLLPPFELCKKPSQRLVGAQVEPARDVRRG